MLPVPALEPDARPVAVGRWQPTQRLAQGGGGEVWLARDHADGDESWVIKYAKTPDLVAALAREWRALHAIALPLLPEPAWWAPLGPGEAALVLRRVAGVPLGQALRGLPAPQVLAATIELLSSLAVIHAAGWVHGDLHPGNILAARVGDGLQLHVLDLGLADRVGDPVRGPGLLACAAPDRLRAGTADPRDDLFSLALALWQAWRGTELWPSYPARLPAVGAHAELPPLGTDPAEKRLLALLRAMASVDRSHRPQTAEAALSSLDADAADLQRWSRVLVEAAHRPRLDLAAARLFEAKHPGATVAWAVGPIQQESQVAVRSWLTLAAERESPFAWLAADPLEGALLVSARAATPWVAPHTRQPAVLGDGAVQAGLAASAWLCAELADLGPAGVLVAGPVDSLPAPLVWALHHFAGAGAGGWVLRAAAASADSAAPTWPRPGCTAAELSAWLSAAAGGRRWDGGLVAHLAAATSGQLPLAATAATVLLQRSQLVWLPGEVAAAPGDVEAAVAAAVSAVQHPDLPSALHWPLLAWLAAVGTATAGDDVAELGLQVPAEVDGQLAAWLWRDATGGLQLRSAASQNRLESELPAHLVAQALRVAAERERHAAQRAILRVRAWQRDGQLPPTSVEIGMAVESLQSRGASQAVALLASAWLPSCREHAGPELARIAAAWLRAVAESGNLSEAADLTKQWPPSWSDEPTLALARAELCFRTGDYPGCRALAEAVLARDSHQAEAWLWLAFAATWQGERQAAQPAMVRAAALAVPGGDTADLLDYLQGLHEYYAGQLDPAERRLAGLLKRARPGLLPAVQGALGLVAHRRGDLAQARHHYGLAASLAQAQGDRPRALNMAMNLAVIDHESGELGAALAGYHRVIDLADQTGNLGAAARAKTNRGNLLASLGLLEAALGDLSAAVPIWQEVANHHLLGNALCVLGEIARRQGRAGEAAALLASADLALEQAGAATERLEIQIELGQLELAAGQVEPARQRALAVRQAAAAGGHSEWHGRALTLLAQCDLDAEPWLAVPREAMAGLDDDLRMALDLLPASKALHRNQACALRVRLLLQRGQIDEARQLAQQQVGVLQRVAATLRGVERAAFERDPADAAARTLLQALAQLPEVPHGGSARPGLVPTLLAVNRRLGEQRDIPQILETLMDSAILLTGAERGFLVLDEGDTALPAEVRATQLKVAVARNLDRENLKKPQHKLSHTVAEEVFLSGEPVLSLDAQADSRFAEQASVHGGALRSILCVALRSQTGSLGVVYVDNRFASGAFTDEHATVLSALADQAAIAIQTARMLQTQRDTAEALRRSRAEVEALNAQLRSQLAEVEHELDDVRADLQAQRLAIVHRSDYSQIRGESPQLLKVFALMDRVRDHDFPLLLAGESGTGKELVARAIHFTGRRKRGPFVAVNCGALPANLLESELFGHARGSFTGAVAERRGLFEAAHTGTLLLDEVGEMPLDMQVKLLRVLQTSEFNRVGESTLRRVDVRVIAATHRDLAAMVRAGTFREDLLYRLKVVELRIPPLRERPGDIALLADFFIRENRAANIGKVESIAKPALQRLLQFPWPGNVRQLEMVLKSACLFADSTVLERADVDSLLQREHGGDVPTPRGEVDAWWTVAPLDAIEARVVAARLEAMGGNKRKAAESLGIDRGTLYKKLQLGAASGQGES